MWQLSQTYLPVWKSQPTLLRCSDLSPSVVTVELIRSWYRLATPTFAHTKVHQFTHFWNSARKATQRGRIYKRDASPIPCVEVLSPTSTLASPGAHLRLKEECSPLAQSSASHYRLISLFAPRFSSASPEHCFFCNALFPA
jgi:3-oxoacyl-ACP reductase-like protein